MRVLITGAMGFAGSHLTDQCVAEGWDVHGTCVEAEMSQPRRPGLTPHLADLRDAAAIRRVVAEKESATRMRVPSGGAGIRRRRLADPAKTLTENLVMTLRVLDAVRLEAPGARVLTIGSSEEYGVVDPESFPIDESQPLRDRSLWCEQGGVRDAGAPTRLCLRHARGVRAAIQPRRPAPAARLRAADFAAQIAAIEREAVPPVLKVGNLNTARDFTDVRDVVRGYRLMLEAGEPGAAYNVCSGRLVRIGDMLDLLVGACAVPVKVQLDPALTRPIDRPASIGSFARLQSATGWRPAIPSAQSVLNTLDYWRTEAPATT